MRYFKLTDFNCQETGNNEMSEDFLNKLMTFGTYAASHLSLQAVTEIHPIVLRQEKQRQLKSQEHMLEELHQTYELITGMRPITSLNTRNQWDLMA